MYFPVSWLFAVLFIHILVHTSFVAYWAYSTHSFSCSYHDGCAVWVWNFPAGYRK